MSGSFSLGVVESRGDPMLLGRCKVRVFGAHTEDKMLLPTDQLPWAIPLQSVTSAAMNGIGNNPVGPVEGTWVLITFLDGDEKQQPIIMGTLGGIPSDRANLWENKSDGLVMDTATGSTTSQSSAGISSGSGVIMSSTTTSNVVDSSGQPVKTGSGGNLVSSSTTVDSGGTTWETGYAEKIAFTYPWILQPSDIEKLRVALLSRESTNNYNAINRLGFVGGYQFGAIGLADIGYVMLSIGYNNGKLKDPKYWLGKNGIKSLDDFFKNTAEQDVCCLAYFKKNFGYLKSRGSINENTTRKELCGLLAAAHLVGASGASQLVKGVVKQDANGVTAQDYYNMGYSCIEGDQPISPPTTNVAPPSAGTVEETASDKTTASQISTLLKTQFGFKDPNGQYPLLSYIGEPDTSRLARHQNIAQTIVPEKIQTRLIDVQKANDKGTWTQSPTPYNSVYPYNHVTETESGHIMEFDDSPGCERINIHHMTGTFTEVDANGTRVNRIVGDGFTIIERNGYIDVAGECVFHVSGNANIYVENDADLQVDGNVLANLNNNLDANVAGKMNLNVSEELQIKAKSIKMQTHTGTIDLNSAATINMVAMTSVNTISGTSITHSAGDRIALVATGVADIVSSKSVNMDAPKIHWNSRTTTSSKISDPGTKTSLPVGIIRATPIAGFFEDLTLPNYVSELDMNNYESDDPQAVAAYVDDKLASKQLSQIDADQIALDLATPPPALAVDITPTTPAASVYVPTPAASPDGSFPMSLQLSPNFKLKDLCIGSLGVKVIVPQHGLSAQQIVSNLTNLAVNVLEPIKKAFPNMIISSGLRGVGNPVSQTKTTSWHELGKACDMQFTNMDPYDVVVKLKDLIPYDELILEYSNNKATRWVHVQFSNISNRSWTLTMNNGHTYPKPGAKGFVKLA